MYNIGIYVYTGLSRQFETTLQLGLCYLLNKTIGGFVSRKYISLVLSLLLPLLGQAYTPAQQDHIEALSGDTQLVQAMKQKRDTNYVEAADLVVTKILPDDTQGLPHQRWLAHASDGGSVLLVYNSDMGARIPVKVGDHFAAGGQFIWSNQGPLLHWLHEDTRNKRPDGFVYYGGVIYGEPNNNHSRH